MRRSAYALPVLVMSLCAAGGAGAAPALGERAAPVVKAPSPDLSDRVLLDRLERAAVQYFLDEADPVTGLVKDRAANWGTDDYRVCNIAPTGTGLACVALASRRGWVSRADAIRQARKTLRFVETRVPHDHGWIPRFLNLRTGQREWNCETSTVDTTLFIWGARLAALLLRDPEVTALTERLSRRLDWTYVLTDGGARPDELLVSHGIAASGSFLRTRWDNYSEGVLIYFLGLGAPRRPLPRASWAAWDRNWAEYQGIRTYACPPLFTFLLPMAQIDVRRLRDPERTDLWGALVRKVQADIRFCRSQNLSLSGTRASTASASRSPLFGVSACDGPQGYRAYGSPPGHHEWDGTLHPPMMAASVMVRPREALAGIRHLLRQHQREMRSAADARRWERPGLQGGYTGRGLWGKYGLPGGFNPSRDWVARDQIGLDLAILVLALENHRSGLPWRVMARDPWLQRAMRVIEGRDTGGQASR